MSTLSVIASITPAYAQSSLSLSQLINAVSFADSELRALELEMGELQEAGNKALADLRDAQSRSEQARIGVAAAADLLDKSQAALERAQARLDELSQAVYRQGVTTTSVAGFDTDAALDRSTYLRQQVEQQQEVVDDLERERTEYANNESLLREAEDLAEARQTAAEEAAEESQAIIAANQATIDELATERTELVVKRDEANAELAQARGDTDDESPPGTESTAGTESTTETVTVEEVDEPENVPGAEAAEQVAEVQPEHASFEDPYVGEDGTDPAPQQAPETTETSVTTEETQTTTTAETEDATEPSADLSALLPELELPADEPVSSGDSSLVETVIARAQSQIGVPYAWGGGDANGPTNGIRDGGVADANGDYALTGFDCSGLVLYAFAGVGIDLPHYTGYQYLRGTPVSHDEMQRGDLIFYGPGGSQHVAIYLGDGMMLEAPASGGYVQETPVRWSSLSPNAVRLI